MHELFLLISSSISTSSLNVASVNYSYDPSSSMSTSSLPVASSSERTTVTNYTLTSYFMGTNLHELVHSFELLRPLSVLM